MTRDNNRKKQWGNVAFHACAEQTADDLHVHPASQRHRERERGERAVECYLKRFCRRLSITHFFVYFTSLSHTGYLNLGMSVTIWSTLGRRRLTWDAKRLWNSVGITFKIDRKVSIRSGCCCCSISLRDSPGALALAPHPSLGIN